MSFAENQGTKIYWDEQGTGAPILLIMGLGYPSAMWYRMRPGLSASTSAAAAGQIAKNGSRIPKPRDEIGNRILPPAAPVSPWSFALSSSRGPAQTSIP